MNAHSSKLIIGVIGSGKGSNFHSIQSALATTSIPAKVGCVISDVENAYILERARHINIPAFHVDMSPFKTKLEGAAEEKVIEIMRRHGVGLIALAGFMRLVKPGLLKAFPNRVINIHPSLLPAFPGLRAWEQALHCGVKFTGCTVHFVDEGMDTGPIIVQRVVSILDRDTPETLHARIQEQEHTAYPEAIKLIAGGLIRLEGRRVIRLASDHQTDF
ncbi:MAG TPA: phosphoribosylglycinamide formyltransferase [Kiritimatiellia bacterium]|nr:phosphoribosylglycinamide formyltransferase [Kiritimatiellia bacterium]